MAILILTITESEKYLDQEKSLYGFEVCQEIKGESSRISFLPLMAKILHEFILEFADAYNKTISGELVARDRGLGDPSETIEQVIAELARGLKLKIEAEFPEELSL